MKFRDEYITRMFWNQYFFLRRKKSYIFLKIFQSTIGGLFFRRKKISRTNEYIHREYGVYWNTPETFGTSRNELEPALKNGRVIMARPIDRKTFVLREFADIFASVRPESVLELGSGNGLNVLALAVLCPFIKTWGGVELAPAGVDMAENYVKNPPWETLEYLTKESREVIAERLKNATFDFRCGDITELPHEDNAFDCAYSYNVIEQIPKRYMDAFRHAKRVAKRYALFVEPFAEAQRSIFQYFYLVNQDHFRASFRRVREVGLTVLRFEPLAYGKIKQGNALLVCSSQDVS